MKNCRVVVHRPIEEQNILQKMVKIVKKKTDMHVKEKVLGLVYSWQEAFGGPGGGYPQYYLAYEELRRMGFQFPERPLEDDPPGLFPQTHPVSSSRSPGFGPPSFVPTRLDELMKTESPRMSLADIETAHRGLEVLTELLNAVNPHDRLALKDELIVELVEECRATQSQVKHLVNITIDEKLLQQVLVLNNDLQQVLAKHDAILSGTLPMEELLPGSSDQFAAFDLKTDGRKDRSSNFLIQEGQASSSPIINKQSAWLALPAPFQANSSKSSLSTESQRPMDLLSGDAFEDKATPTPATSALVAQSIGELVVYSPVPEAGNRFVSSPVETLSSLQYPFGLSDQQQSSQQHPSVNGNLQQYSSSNGSSLTSSEALPQQPYKLHQTSILGQSFIQPVTNIYAASWGMPGRQPISSERIALVSSPGLQSPHIQLPPQQVAYPPAPWSDPVPQLLNPEQRAMLRGDALMPVSFSEVQLYSQQNTMTFDQSLRLYSGGSQQNMIVQQPQANSLQNGSECVRRTGQSSEKFSHQLLVSYTQTLPLTPSKPVNHPDKVFKDLVDLQKLASSIKPTEI
ncbi:hypothetical protein O6H91_01G034500 [Diphasiastrum complanatum]|nr:hypothetical protein O6H91_01G034500 [Diphasiastrum complanatum]KAJ7568493.1 hypothetical protein O6H91_01G034500 [Diphasiastrum complanatum]KAJ7568494.1 hypothetical protein O6H91_01G034500 [Diphasiastrum complanatum]